MDKKQVLKNKLDLKYHKESQKLNLFVTLFTAGISGLLGTFIWLKETNLFYYGIAITFFIFIIGIILYKKSSDKIKIILGKISELY